jgi:hypothetical protein
MSLFASEIHHSFTRSIFPFSIQQSTVFPPSLDNENREKVMKNFLVYANAGALLCWVCLKHFRFPSEWLFQSPNQRSSSEVERVDFQTTFIPLISKKLFPYYSIGKPAPGGSFPFPSITSFCFPFFCTDYNYALLSEQSSAPYSVLDFKLDISAKFFFQLFTLFRFFLYVSFIATFPFTKVILLLSFPIIVFLFTHWKEFSIPLKQTHSTFLWYLLGITFI